MTGWAPTALTGHPAYGDHSRETFDAILQLAERLAADRFAPHYKKSDRVEPTLENGVVRVLPEIREAIAAYAGSRAVRRFVRSGAWRARPAACRRCGGDGPFHGRQRLDRRFPMLTAGNARVLTKFGSKAQIETFALPEIEGRTMGHDVPVGAPGRFFARRRHDPRPCPTAKTIWGRAIA